MKVSVHANSGEIWVFKTAPRMMVEGSGFKLELDTRQTVGFCWMVGFAVQQTRSIKDQRCILPFMPLKGAGRHAPLEYSMNYNATFWGPIWLKASSRHTGAKIARSQTKYFILFVSERFYEYTRKRHKNGSSVSRVANNAFVVETNLKEMDWSVRVTFWDFGEVLIIEMKKLLLYGFRVENLKV
ncbi:uncharacterized protein BJ212DRAFT_1304493 [Suillus subaureus]|uniref:Uncharacterized protein n=1 Tax=Suillus subaureus TaxID=48587 RepID=A0A9P7J5S7_9AGAM|nr:uncharacterized protein BJ212DRAFT_1304493 [Suillus subaureus]KAG1803981.1 hypothetical protein BJ212DRAFT_1304493 [Suillus subaureus]